MFQEGLARKSDLAQLDQTEARLGQELADLRALAGRKADATALEEVGGREGRGSIGRCVLCKSTRGAHSMPWNEDAWQGRVRRRTWLAMWRWASWRMGVHEARVCRGPSRFVTCGVGVS